ncbi:hypothetical protein RhiXN_00587 [Rhizoctonia solani]|uniref:Uncharacterized protein n=1 Tax=Rhizoctonia solani TaxID=456999 RepID=A0A8H8SUQ7_9AGAM|nr:uncharacterized protein RhiXN_00587 [Rhizoctonia solani]QRW19181.1 hypothetical protein RhiXN_00587 [Rhizoctonia solani]
MFTEAASKGDIENYKHRVQESGGSIKYHYDIIKGIAITMPDDHVQSFANDPIVSTMDASIYSEQITYTNKRALVLMTSYFWEFVILSLPPLHNQHNFEFTVRMDTVNLNEPHPPTERALEAFNQVLPKIKLAIISSRRDWDKHEPRMWARANHLRDEELTSFVIENDLVEVRAGATSYGTIVFGKIRIPGIEDEEGQGFIHVSSRWAGFMTPRTRYVTNSASGSSLSVFQGTEDVIFHSLFTDEGNPDGSGRPTTFRAIQTQETPLEFFNE